jgi:hypothetical protein
MAIPPKSFRYSRNLSIRSCNVRSLLVLQRLQTLTFETGISDNAGGRVVVRGRFCA